MQRDPWDNGNVLYCTSYLRTYTHTHTFTPVPGKRVQLSPALPSLTHHPPPLSTLHLPPPQLEIGKIMMDSSSGEEEGDTT